MYRNIIKLVLVLFFGFFSLWASATTYTGTIDCSRLTGSNSLVITGLPNGTSSNGSYSNVTLYAGDSIALTESNGSCTASNTLTQLAPTYTTVTESNGVLTLSKSTANGQVTAESITISSGNNGSFSAVTTGAISVKWVSEPILTTSNSATVTGTVGVTTTNGTSTRFFAGSGGVSPFTYTASGSLPTGLSYYRLKLPSTYEPYTMGVPLPAVGYSSAIYISGTPTAAATGSITITATDANGHATSSITLTMNIIDPNAAPLASQGAFNVTASPASIAPSAGTSTLSTSGGSGTGAVTYAVTSGASSCTLSGSTVTATSTTGTCTITATKAADSSYSATTATVNITVSNRAGIADAVDSTVTGTVLAQATAAQRFAEGQIKNVSDHIQGLRRGFNVKNNQVALGLNMPGVDPLKQAAQEIGNAFKQQNVVKVAQNEAAQAKSDIGSGYIKLAQADTLPSDISVTNADARDANLNDRLFGNKNIGVWASGTLDYGSMNHNDFRTSGVTVGVDYQFNPYVIMGASVGYGFDNADIDHLGSRVKSHQTTGTFYGIYRTDSDWFVDALIGYGDLSIKNNRYSSAASSVFSANRDGDTVFGSVGVAKFFKVQKLDLQPYARLTQMSSTLDAYNEGSNVNALAYDQATIVSRAVSVGFTAAYDIVLQNGKLTPNAKFELRHNARGSINQTISYADTPAEAMTYSSTPAPDDIQSLGLGVSYLAKNGISSDVSWFGSIGSNSYHSNALRLNVSLPF